MGSRCAVGSGGAPEGAAGVLLTSRSDEIDRVTGLETGADDYVIKPFSTRELVAPIRAIARRLVERTPPWPASLRAHSPPDPRIDPARFEVRWNGHEVPLTRSEFLVLSALATRAGRVLGAPPSSSPTAATW